MEKYNVGKVLAMMTVVFCVGCMGPKPHSSPTSAGTNNSTTADSVDARTGAGTGTGGTETDSAGTGSAASGAGTGTGGTDTSSTGK
jgi:hypothetical protein